METKLIRIDSLVTENLQVRVALDENAIADYAEAMKDGSDFPPIVVFKDPKRAAEDVGPYLADERAAEDVGPYLADGFHRVEAARRAGLETILAEVHEGTFDDALAFALKANDKHGVRRTNEDKRNAMRIAWENRTKLFGDKVPSVRHFAAICGVSIGNSHAFLENNGVFKLNTTPDADAPKADAVTVTRAHLEERNPAVREKLKDGKDRFGIDIPERLKPAFQSREPKLLVRELNGIYDDLEKRRLNGDVVFAPFVGHAMTHLANLVNTVRHGTVYCVCRMCRGRGCGSCNNLGFQTRAQYDRNPVEFKAENV